jgi:hypothetical protein
MSMATRQQQQQKYIAAPCLLLVCVQEALQLYNRRRLHILHDNKTRATGGQ